LYNRPMRESRIVHVFSHCFRIIYEKTRSIIN